MLITHRNSGYHWLKDNRKFSKKMTSLRVMTNILCFKKDLPALPPREFFHFYIMISNHKVFVVQFGINLHLWVFQKRLANEFWIEREKPYDYLYWYQPIITMKSWTKRCIISNYWTRLSTSMIWRIMQIEEGVIRQSRRLETDNTLREICISSLFVRTAWFNVPWWPELYTILRSKYFRKLSK